jgi:hypothetical protein
MCMERARSTSRSTPRSIAFGGSWTPLDHSYPPVFPTMHCVLYTVSLMLKGLIKYSLDNVPQRRRMNNSKINCTVAWWIIKPATRDVSHAYMHAGHIRLRFSVEAVSDHQNWKRQTLLRDSCNGDISQKPRAL